jgi:solute carrier family 25 oxoglutarate transporter 11
MDWKRFAVAIMDAQFVQGGLASMIAGYATHPLDLIKVRMQLQGEVAAVTSLAYALEGKPVRIAMPRIGPVGMCMNVVQTEGIRALYSGVSASVLRQFLYSSTRIGLYEHLKMQWRDPRQQQQQGTGLPLVKKVTAALLAGAAGAAVGNPADLAMVRMQADGRLPSHLRRNYKSVTDALVRMVRQDGLKSLWRGSATTVTRAMLVTAAQLATYDQITEAITLHKLVPQGLATQVIASCSAGVLASMAATPVDVVKTRVMNQRIRAGEPPPYTGALDCAFKTVRSEGPMALYKGFIPTVTRQGPFAIVMFLSLEQMRKILQNF